MNGAKGRGYGQAFVRVLPLLLLISFAVALIAQAASQKIAPEYRVSFSYLVSLSERETDEEFNFDGYYALQATDSFATTLAEWVSTPEVIVAAFKAADLPLTTQDPRVLRGIIDAEKTAPQLVEVTIAHADQQTAERLTRGLHVAMSHNLDVYHQQGIPKLVFRVVATEPWTGKRQISGLVIVVVAFVFTFFFATNIFLLMHSIRAARDTTQ